MKKRIEKLRAQLAECKRTEGGRRAINEALRSEAIRLALQWEQSGRSRGELGRLLDVAPNMLTRWVEERRRQDKPRVRRIVAMETGRADGGHLVLVLASGHRIEGLCVDDALKIATALS